MQRHANLSLLLAGLLLAACSQQMGRQSTAQQVGGLAAAKAAPQAAQVDLHDVVLHPGMHVQGLGQVSPAVMGAIDADFKRDVQNYSTGSKDQDPGRTQITTIAALKAKGMFTADVYADSTQVVLKSAHGAFQDVYDSDKSIHPPFKELVAIYDPQTGDPLGVGLPSRR